MKVSLRFSEGTLSQLQDVLADANESSKEKVTERSWLSDQVNLLNATYALAWRQLEGSGWFSFNEGPAMFNVKLGDLREMKFEPGESGTAEIILGDRTLGRIERACSIQAARNRAMGREAQQTWRTVREWLELNLIERIAQARAQIDVREIAEEQKAAEGSGDERDKS